MIKRSLIGLFVMGMAVYGAYADQSNWSGTFKTIGPDKYADGTVVRDGEYYAIVWRNSDVPFAGFKEGTSLPNDPDAIIQDPEALVVDKENAQLIYAIPWAADGFLYDVGYTVKDGALKPFSHGTFSIYVLDTRRFAAPTCTYGEDGRITSVTTNVLDGIGSVQGYVEAVGYVYIKGEIGADVTGSTVGKSYLLSTIDNTVVPDPIITNMQVEKDYVVLTFKATKPNIAYNAVTSGTVSDVKSRVGSLAVAPVSGAATVHDEVQIRIRRKEGATSEFFNIIRNPMN